jgi:lipopolysaccharide export system permease protein
MRLSIIDRYLLAETFKTWLGAIVVLAAIMLGNTFSQFLSRAAGGEFDEKLLLGLVGATSASYFKTLIPISLLLAILLSLGRFYRDNEMAVINACGIGLARLYRPFLLLAVAIALVTAWLSLDLAPSAHARARALREDARLATNLAATGSGQFQTMAGGLGALFAEYVSPDDAEMKNVFIWFSGRAGAKVIWAEQGFQHLDTAASKGDLLLVNGTRYEGGAGENTFHITQFRQHGLHLPISRGPDEVHRGELPTMDLIKSDSVFLKAELQRRLSPPMMVLVLTLLAVPLARVSPRQGRYGRLVLGILCYLLYSNMLAVTDAWIVHDEIPAAVGVWWVHGSAVLLIALMFWMNRDWLRRRRMPVPA